MKKLSLWIKTHKLPTAVIALLAIGLSAGVQMRAKKSDTVFSEPLRKGTILEGVYGIGTVRATRSFQFNMGVTSTLRHIHVREGDRVTRGTRLLELDGGVVFNAPFAGTITQLPYKVGETVFAQSAILSLVDLRDRYITVFLEQQGAIRVRPGQKAKISFDSMRDETYDGIVESVYSNDTNFLVRITAHDLPAQILPGMTADVAIAIKEYNNVLLVPVAAIQDGKVLVKPVNGGRKREVEIKTGVVDGAMAQLISGDLSEGEMVQLRKKAVR